MRIVYIINITRFLVLTLSILTLGCHAVQCALLSIYQKETNIPGWLQAGYYQYLAWYMSLSVSTMSAMAICLHAVCCGRAYILIGDRFLSVLNILPLATSILTAVLIEGNQPWTDNRMKYASTLTSLFTRCSTPTATGTFHIDNSHPILYKRCLLSDGTLVGATITCGLWALLACIVYIARPAKGDSTDENTRIPAKEPNWGRYIPEPPASLRSTSLMKSNLRPRPTNLHRNPYEPPLSFINYSYDGQPGYRRASKTYFDDYHCGDSCVSPCTPYQPPSPASGPILPMIPAIEEIQGFGPPYCPPRNSGDCEHSFVAEQQPYAYSSQNSDTTTATQSTIAASYQYDIQRDQRHASM